MYKYAGVILSVFLLLQVKTRTSSNPFYSSHVMQYGDTELKTDMLALYMGTNPANENFTYVDDNSLRPSSSNPVNQRDADLIHFWNKVLVLYYQLFTQITMLLAT